MRRAAPRTSGGPHAVSLGHLTIEGDALSRAGTDVDAATAGDAARDDESRDDEFGAFVELRWSSLVRFGFLLTGDWAAAEDLTQAALERTWRRWDRVQVDHPESYVKAAMANQMRSRWRRRSVEVADGHSRDGASAQDMPADLALREALWTELLRLPDRMRAVIVLRVWEDLSEAETARLLGCSTGSVKSQMSRGMRRLRERPGVLEAAGRARPGTDDERVEPK